MGRSTKLETNWLGRACKRRRTASLSNCWSKPYLLAGGRAWVAFASRSYHGLHQPESRAGNAPCARTSSNGNGRRRGLPPRRQLDLGDEAGWPAIEQRQRPAMRRHHGVRDREAETE
jgi:hypothetical protein